LLTARRRFFDNGTAPRGLVPDTILRSWQRCTGLGLSAYTTPEVEPMPQQALREACEKYENLRRVCRPELETLYADARATGSIAILSAPDGLILEAIGSADFLDKASRVALTPGVPWAESATGTNAIGTAMIEGRAIEVRGAEHFFAPHRVLSCSAVPIIDPFGKIAGVLDLSGEASVHHTHALGMVRLAVDQIESRLFERDFPGCRVLRVQREASLFGTPCEGIVVFEGERLVAANRYGLDLLGLGRGDLGRRRFEELFEARLRDLTRDTSLRDAQGRSLLVRVDADAGKRAVVKAKPMAIAATTIIAPVFDAQLERELDRAQRVLVAGMPVLLSGETGTGKEVFAHELHRRTLRRDTPFVAVNCAGLPEGLIESELFGYEEGAFTGARRHGAKGLLREADGGVLFLDEIGDMPLPLQARLLRVLQEREVTPLGGGRPVKVEFALISATHQDLDVAVANGRFRSDLYFRIAHYSVQLPALREHADRRALIEMFWSQFAAASAVSMDDLALTRLADYAWPGNLRQLNGTLRTLVALADRQGRVTVADLPAAVLSAPHAGTVPADAGQAASLAGITAQAMRSALSAAAGNVSAAARKLGISRSTLYRRLSGSGAAAK
jgi:transcriptional regulator of acetoin/glycerol metabolism